MTSWSAILVSSLSDSNPVIPRHNSWSRCHWGGRIIYSVTPSLNCSNFLPSFLPNWAKIPPHKYLDHGLRMKGPIPRDYRGTPGAWARTRFCGRSESWSGLRSCDTPPTGPPTPESAGCGRGIKLSAWLAEMGICLCQSYLFIRGHFINIRRENETSGHHKYI